MSNIRELMKQERLRRLQEKQKPQEQPPPPPTLSTRSLSSTSQTNIATSTPTDLPFNSDDTISFLNQLTPSKLQTQKLNAISSTRDKIDSKNSQLNSLDDERENNLHLLTSEKDPTERSNPSVFSEPHNFLPEDFFDSSEIENTDNPEDEVLPSNGFSEDVEEENLTMSPINHHTIEDKNSETNKAAYDINSTITDWEYEIIEPDDQILHYTNENEITTLGQAQSTTELQDSLHNPTTQDLDTKAELLEISGADFGALNSDSGQVNSTFLPFLDSLAELKDFEHYQPLDTVYHSSLGDETAEENLGSIPQGTLTSNSSKNAEEAKSTADIPVGFFDDADADAEARGEDGPTKRRKKNLEKDFRRFTALMDVEILKSNLSQTLVDAQQHQNTIEEDLGKQKSLSDKLSDLRQKRSILQNIKKESLPKTSRPYFNPYEDDSISSEGDEDELDWRSKQMF